MELESVLALSHAQACDRVIALDGEHRERRGWLGLRFIKFNVSSIVSPIIIVVTTIVLHSLSVSPYLSSMVGVLIGFTWNWTMTSLVIWRKHRTTGL